MCKPDETIEMEKQIVLCVADCSSQHEAILSQTTLSVHGFHVSECSVSQTTHFSWMMSAKGKGTKKNNE